MKIELKDQDLRDIIKVAIKEEIEFLTKALLERKDIRQVLWDFTRNQVSDASLLKESGLDDTTAATLLEKASAQNQLPSGSAGGANTGGSDDGKSGGGGGGNSSGGNDSKSGGGGQAAKPRGKKV